MTTPVIMDITAAAVLLLFLLIGAKQGFVRAVAGLVIVAISLVGAAMIAASFTGPVTKFVAPVIEEKIADEVEEAITDHTGALDVQRQDPELSALLDMLGLDDDARDAISARAEESIVSTGATVISAVVESVMYSVVYAVLFLLSFLLLLLLLHILAKAMDLLTKLPGLHALNALGGAVTGLIKGALVLFLAIWVLRRLGVSFETYDVSRTHILQFFATHTPLSALSLLQ